ncbi:hypothetical protein NLJ89_g1271 [Agrocybe chaxingu]|uniref:BCD1 alpha/beta domain-containing protein n=1 Tax=Agrocybe chaxingu TaxID=84603 RepID=A0A9W8TDQ2_9AGAR|nr:hypothetical protein NLJ89_g1271 [Agrocybe chaxingu]
MTRRDTLKIQLEARDIDVDLLPMGMERRKLNQSSWDGKNQTALLTIEFKFYKPKDPLAPSSQPRDPPLTLLTHKNDTKTPLLSLIRSRVVEGIKSKKESTHPQWVKQLVFPDADDPESFTNPQCVMAAKINPLTLKRLVKPTTKGYYSLDPTQPLSKSLRHTEFVEFPTIEIWDEFLGTILDARGIVKQHEERPLKRRKTNSKAGRAAIAGLLGGYGSSEEEVEVEPKNVLASLEEYDGDDGDDEVGSGGKDSLEDVDFGALSDENAEEIALNPAALLELMAKVRGGEPWAVEDEAVDWGDVDDPEPEWH